MEPLAWALFGALIGGLAAQKKGFSVVLGVVGGAFLGPLALLMFFVSSVGKGDKQKKCPSCAEWIKAEATICKHCKSAVPAA